jgi:hypothetical protein
MSQQLRSLETGNVIEIRNDEEARRFFDDIIERGKTRLAFS